MSHPVSSDAHDDAIDIGSKLKSGTPWKKLDGERATGRHAGQLARKWHSKLIVVFNLSDGFQYYCGLNKQGLLVKSKICPPNPGTHRSQKRRSR